MSRSGYSDDMMRLAFLIAAMLLSACEKPAESTSVTTNAEIKVETLFTHEGCTTYRFTDGNHRYYTRCRDGRSVQTTAEYTQSCGKNCTRRVTTAIETIED